MKHVIIGTAGHVDHGKTWLVQALTGVDTDRLSEEKRRGITIDLGFAPLDLPGVQASIVDVPGHEKFIKNMLAGAGGIDLALLTVAADEGFMPQTAEHLNILDLLGVQSGLVVITKADLVDGGWLGMVEQDIRRRVKGTFLEGCPILAVSSLTGAGIPALRDALGQLAARTAEKNPRAPFRLPIDRIFSVDGFGTVATGTLIEGVIRTGDAVQMFPSGVAAKVRGLQVHGQTVDAAYAGQRTAVNLAGVKKSDLRRGETAARPGCVSVSLMLDVRLRNLSSSRRTIQHNSQVHLYHGTSAQLAKVVLLDRERLPPGESGYAQLRLAKPIAAKAGDRFVIRFLSPPETIGGGVILDDSPRRHRQGDQAAVQALRVRESGSEEERLAQALAAAGDTLTTRETLAERFAMPPADTEQLLGRLVRQGRAVELLPGRYLSAEALDRAWEACGAVLSAYHGAHPLHGGMGLAELRQKLRTSPETADAILAQFQREGRIRQAAGRYALAEFQIRLTRRQRAIRETLLDRCLAAGLNMPSQAEALAWFPPSERGNCTQVLESLLTSGELVMPAPRLLLHGQVYRQVRQTARDWFASHDTLTLAQFRDLLHTSRDRALVLLESFDRCGLTRREGDLRRAASLL